VNPVETTVYRRETHTKLVHPAATGFATTVHILPAVEVSGSGCRSVD
jgi:hypothetical protein